MSPAGELLAGVPRGSRETLLVAAAGGPGLVAKRFHVTEAEAERRIAIASERVLLAVARSYERPEPHAPR